MCGRRQHDGGNVCSSLIIICFVMVLLCRLRAGASAMHSTGLWSLSPLSGECVCVCLCLHLYTDYGADEMLILSCAVCCADMVM